NRWCRACAQAATEGHARVRTLYPPERTGTRVSRGGPRGDRHQGHAIQPVDRPLLVIWRHQRQIPVSLQQTAMTMARCEAVLFDLAGTLVDSAPDLAGAANDLRASHGMPPLGFEALRPMVGAGARGMVGAAFGVAPGDARFEGLRDAF